MTKDEKRLLIAAVIVAILVYFWDKGRVASVVQTAGLNSSGAPVVPIPTINLDTSSLGLLS